MQNKELTGYPSIDKPWLKHYQKEEINALVPEGTIYENIYKNNDGHINDVAILYFGKKITYKKLFNEIDKTAKAIIANGIKAGDNVAICMPATPEAVYTILALNKIGANANMLNPTFTKAQLIDRINDTEAKILIVVNELYEVVRDVIQNTTIKKVVSASSVNSLGVVAKVIKKVKRINGTTDWNDFINSGKNEPTVKETKCNKDIPAIMVYSSGTTGASKGIQLTNKGIMTLLVDAKSVFVEMQRQDKYFVQIPIWFSTGLVATLLTSLYYGLTAMLEPIYDFNIFYKHIIKYKPNYMITATGLVDYLYSFHYKNSAYKSFKCLAIGGEYVTETAEKRFNSWLKANGNDIKLQKGYGMCELGSIVTAASIRYNTIGSAGIPTPHVVVSAFDFNTGKELKYGERGEIRVCSPCRMLGYYKNKEATDNFFDIDENNNIWACTGDMGCVTEDGNVYVSGRMSDSYINDNDETIYLFDIERAVLSVENVRQCKVVVSNVDGHNTHVAHITLLDNSKKENTLIEIKQVCTKLLKTNHQLTFVKYYTDALPVSPSGKLNSAKMSADIECLIKL